MVCTVTVLGGAQSSVRYFEGDGYYVSMELEHRRASGWHGAGATALGLRGHVYAKRFEQVLAGYVPHTRIRLGRKRDGEHQHRPGLDITLSAPKSVSLEGLVFGERRVVRAHDEAVRATLDWIESDLLQTRGYDPATGRRPREGAHGMVAALFRHLTSRNQDPQLHTHCVVANMTRNANGEWRSLETTKIRRSAKLIGAYYRNTLAQRLQALGYAITPTLIGRIPGFEIAGYDRSFLDAFSGRRREILQMLETNGLPYTPALAQMAALHTRRRKVDIGLGVLIPQWRTRARELGLTRSVAETRPPRPLDPDTGKRSPRVQVPAPDLPANVVRNRKRAPALPDLRPDAALNAAAPSPTGPAAPATLLRAREVGMLEAVARAVAALEERMAVFPATELQVLVLGHAPGRYTLAEIDAGIARLVREGKLVEAERRGADRAFVTDRAIRAERRILAVMRAGRNEGRTFAGAGAIESALARTSLTAGQRAAVAAIARAPDWLIGIQGHAGSGKTTMLRAAAALPGMPKVHGLAPSSAAVRALAQGAGIEARTLQWFLTRFDDLSDPERLARGREAFAGTVLAVDEASMIGTVQMEALLRIAKKLQVARVVLLGDTRQLRAVDAGQPFRVLQKAGMATTVMDEVLRQRDPTLAAAVAHVRDGAPDLALRTLGEGVQETDRETLGEAAGRIWLALPDDARAETAVLAPTHAMRREIHAAIREGLALEGTLHGRPLVIERLIDRRLGRVETADLRSYAEGDTVVFHRDAYGCRRDDVCTVARVGDNSVELAHPDGTPRRFRPSGNASRYLGVFDTRAIEIRAGERIRWTRNRTAPRARFGRPQAPDLVNGDTAEVLAIDDRRVHLQTEHGERIALARSDPQLRHLDHAYSSTVHGAQGRTARSVIAVLGSAGLTDQTMLYVEMSRASDEFVLLTDDREALAEVLVHRPGLEESALEAIGEALTSPPVVEPEVFEKLRADWTAVRTRAETAGDIAYFTEGYTDVMARAAALSAIEDLPADMRRFAESLLAEHRQHRERERTVSGLIRRMQTHWRRWPELGRASPDPETKEPPGHRQWRTDARRMLGTARAWLAADAGIARHLDAMPQARAGLKTAVRDVERVGTLNDYRMFERRWQALRTGPGGSMLHAPDSAELAAIAETLRDAGALTPAQHDVLGEWRAAHAAETARLERIAQYPEEAATLIEAWRSLHHPEDPDATDDPADPLHRTWRNEANASLAKVRSMLAPESDDAPHLSALPDRAAALRRAAVALDDALRTQACRGFDWLAQEVERSARDADTIPFYAPRYRELMAWAESLGTMDGLPDRTLNRLAALRNDHDACLRRRTEIETFPDRAAALLAARDEHGHWHDDGAALIEAGRAMLADAADRPHLDAMPGARNRIARARAPLVAALQAESTSALTDGAYILPCPDRVLPGDRIRCTVRGRSAYRRATGGGKLPIEGEVLAVRGYLASVRITACPDDRGLRPGAVERIPMSELVEFDCLRMLRDDEDERARIEADTRRDIAEAEERVERQRLERDRGEDVDWTP